MEAKMNDLEVVGAYRDPSISLTVEADEWGDDLVSLIEFTIIKSYNYYIKIKSINELSLNINVIYDIDILLSDDVALRELNANYRGIDKPTNILAFPNPRIDEGYRHQISKMPLGSLALSFTRLKEEAEEQEKNIKDHLKHLLIHGFLHLCGHDHELDDEALAMEAIEVQILAKMGIENPYI